MKLYLSSYLFGNCPERLQELVGSNKKTAIIMNATDVYGDVSRPEYLAQSVAELAELGLSGTELDLRRYFGKTDQLGNDLAQFGLLWVTGGNTFALRRAMRESGLEGLLPLLLQQSDLVYGGFSAGACVLTPSLRGIELVDDPHAIPAGYPPKVIWEGLGLVDFHIAPHFQSSHPESSAIDRVVAYFEKYRLSYKALADGEVIIVDAGKVEVVGRANQK